MRAGGVDLWETKELSETVFRRRLEQLDGVAQAAVSGGLDREIRVEVERIEPVRSDDNVVAALQP